MPIDPITGKRLPGRPTRAERQAELAMQAAVMAPPEEPEITYACKHCGGHDRHTSDCSLGSEPSPQPEAVKTAREQIEALRRRRKSMNGLVVKPPASITVESVRKWLAEVAAVGNSGDVEIAWYRLDDIHLKQALTNEYERLKGVAGKRYWALVGAAQAERRAERAAHVRRSGIHRLQREVARADARAAHMRQRLGELEKSSRAV